jgi:hypothetical protein
VIITVDPRFDVFYTGFYLEGLRRAFPDARLRFSPHDFPAPRPQCLSFRIDTQNVYVSAEDAVDIHAAALDWCDLYAKANVDAGSAPASVLPIGPSFGVRLSGAARTASLAVRTFASAQAPLDFVQHFRNHYRQWRHRVPEQAYRPGPSDDGYIFFAASLWMRESKTNEFRARFIRVCQSLPGLRFEGGFAPRESGAVAGFEQLTMRERLGLDAYLVRVRRSAVVFNTPAVLDCHGWKLAEFLALGKAIVSTPLTRALPAPLEHGRHLHIVDGTEASIRDAVQQILSDAAYRASLERQARDYYERYLAPARVIERIAGALPRPVQADVSRGESTERICAALGSGS